MTRAVDKLLDEAMRLTPEERNEFAQFLLDTLKPAVDPFYANLAIEKAWHDEIRRRVDELDSGKVKTVPWEVVRRAALRRIDESRKLRTGSRSPPRIRRRG